MGPGQEFGRPAGGGALHARQRQRHWPRASVPVRLPDEPDQTYLLRRQFVWSSNGSAVASLTVSNLLSGDGTTRWETNAILVEVDRHGASFKVGEEVLAGAARGSFALGISRVTLEPYAIRCVSCGGSAEPAAPGRSTAATSYASV